VLGRIFGLERGDLRPLAGLGAVHALVGGALAVAEASVAASFLTHASAEELPGALAARAIVMPLVSAVYERLAAHRSPRAAMVAVAAIAAAASLGTHALLAGGETPAIAGYVLNDTIASLVQTHWGVYMLHHLHGDAARRSVSILYALARVGGALGAGALAIVAPEAARDGVYLAVGLYAAVALAARLPARPAAASDATPGVSATAPVTAPRAGSGLALLFSHPLVRAIAVSTLAMGAVRFALRYQSQAELDALPERDLARLLALFATGANAAGALLAALGVGRLLRRWGVAPANSLYAIVTFAAQGALLLAGGLAPALGARFTDGELKHALKTPVSALLYEPLAPADRTRARAVVLGLVSPLGQLAVSLGLVALVHAAPEHVGAIGLGACVVFVLATFVANGAYLRASRSPGP
jgi:hypothetical protein